MSTNHPEMSGMRQVIVQPPTDAALDAAAETQRSYVLSGSTIKPIENVGQVIAPATIIAEESIIRLSKNQKLAMAHKGFNEVEATWKTAPSYEEVADGSTTVYRYVAPGEVGVDNGSDVVKGQARTTNLRADTDDGLVITDPGTFTATTITPVVGDGVPVGADTSYLQYVTYSYDGNASSSSANNGLIGPNQTALAVSNAQTLIVDAPGRTGGEAMTDDNYLTVPGRAIRTSYTHTAMMEFIGQIADGLVVKTELTIADLQDIGLPSTMLVSANLTEYQDDIAATGNATAVNTVAKIGQIVHDANTD